MCIVVGYEYLLHLHMHTVPCGWGDHTVRVYDILATLASKDQTSSRYIDQ